MKSDTRNNIHERIEMLVEHFSKGNKTAFGRETEILPGVMASITGGRKNKPSFELLQKILVRYPEVDANWLVLGRGQMLQNVPADGIPHNAFFKIATLTTQFIQTTAQLRDKLASYRDTQYMFEALKEDLEYSERALKDYKTSLQQVKERGAGYEELEKMTTFYEEQIRQAGTRYTSYLPIKAKADAEIIELQTRIAELEKEITACISAETPLDVESQMQAISLSRKVIDAVTNKQFPK